MVRVTDGNSTATNLRHLDAGVPVGDGLAALDPACLGQVKRVQFSLFRLHDILRSGLGDMSSTHLHPFAPALQTARQIPLISTTGKASQQSVCLSLCALVRSCARLSAAVCRRCHAFRHSPPSRGQGPDTRRIAVLKTVVAATSPWVQIPDPPQWLKAPDQRNRAGASAVSGPRGIPLLPVVPRSIGHGRGTAWRPVTHLNPPSTPAPNGTPARKASCLRPGRLRAE